MSDLLQIGKMAVQQGRSNGEEVGVARVVDLHDAPWVLTGADRATANLDSLLGSDNSEWHETSKLSVLLDRVLVVLLNIVWEVVDRNAVVLDVLHHQLLRLGKLGRGQGVCAANDGDDVDTGRQTLHQLDIQLTETRQTVSKALGRYMRREAYPWPVGVIK